MLRLCWLVLSSTVMLLSTALMLSEEGDMVIAGAAISSPSWLVRGLFRCFPSPAPWKKLLADLVWRATPWDDIIYVGPGEEGGL